MATDQAIQFSTNNAYFQDEMCAVTIHEYQTATAPSKETKIFSCREGAWPLSTLNTNYILELNIVGKPNFYLRKNVIFGI